MDPRGRTYTVADGRQIPNKGKKEFSGFSGDGTPIEMGINITDVVKILFSVRSMCRAGNVVLFGADEGSFVINKKSGNVTKIDDDGVNYTLSMFVKKPKVPDPPENKFPRKREKRADLKIKRLGRNCSNNKRRTRRQKRIMRLLPGSNRPKFGHKRKTFVY